MDLRTFVAIHRPGWERLESLLDRTRRSGLRSLEAEDLRDLGLLHRQASADLAAARTFHGGSRIVAYLNDLAVRSHNAVYRSPRRGVREVLGSLRHSIPRTVRAHQGAVAAAILLFFCGALLGAVGTVLDESIAVLVLGSRFVESVRNGEYLHRDMFSVVPHSVASTALLTNNLSVALNTFAFGITGILPAAILVLNGVMLGAVFVLCGRYDLLDRFVPFVVPHGVIELSAIFLAAAGAFTTFDGWLHPGEHTRLQGLRRGAAEGLTLLGAAVPALLVAALVEGFVSPLEEIPAAIRIALGLGLGAVLWLWLFTGSRETPAETGGPDD